MATLPSRIPDRRRWSCEPTATSVACWRPISVSIIGPGGPSTTVVSTTSDCGSIGRDASTAAFSSSRGKDAVRVSGGDQPTATDAPVFQTLQRTTRAAGGASRATWATASRLSSVPSTPHTIRSKIDDEPAWA